LDALDNCAKLAQTLRAALARYEPEALGVYRCGETWCSSLLEYLALLINGEWRRMSLPAGPLNRALATTRLLFGNEAIEYRMPAATRVGAMLGIAQVSSTYGSGEAQTLVENCGNTLILRCSASEHGGTSQFASRLIGEREIVRRQTSRVRDREPWFAARGARRSTSVSRQHVTEMAVLPSELEQLPDLAGYLKTASSPVWLRVRVRRVS
jgi:Type IV secretion-system coupling protein DNA-binding domain/CagE, TrbE, VirB family, component of type IV transporter system